MTDIASELPVLDPSQLETMTGADASLGIEVIDIFRQQTDIWSRMLDASMPASQWADAAHSLKGTALSIGAMRLAHVCSIAEELGRGAAETPVSHTQAAISLSDVKDQIGERPCSFALASTLVITSSIRARS